MLFFTILGITLSGYLVLGLLTVVVGMCLDRDVWPLRVMATLTLIWPVLAHVIYEDLTQKDES